MKVIYHQFLLKLSEVFKISHEVRTEQPTLIVELQHKDFHGYGEATAISYYNVSIHEMISKLKEITPLLNSIIFHSPEELWNEMAPILLEKHSFLLSAIDSAAHDLYGKIHKEKIYETLGGKAFKTPQSNYTISMGTAEEMTQQILRNPWPLYKLKLGKDSNPDTLLRIKEMTNSPLRVDANASWNLEIATNWLPFLQKANVELLEQPFAVDNISDLKKFKKLCEIPIVADESCQKEEDVDFCAKYFDVINIKLMKCGGLTPAIRMAKKAKKLNVKLMAGCMTESSVGISAMTQIAPMLDYIDADGAILLANDPATGVQLKQGEIIYPNLFGLGVELKENYIDS